MSVTARCIDPFQQIVRKLFSDLVYFFGSRTYARTYMFATLKVKKPLSKHCPTTFS